MPRKLDVDLADFHLDLNHQATDDYSGNLEYNRGVVAIDGRAPLRHNAAIRFTATRSGITFERVYLGTRLSQLDAYGSMQGYSKPIVQANYQGRLSTVDLREELPVVPISGGEFEFAGSLSYAAAATAGLGALNERPRLEPNSASFFIEWRDRVQNPGEPPVAGRKLLTGRWRSSSHRRTTGSDGRSGARGI